ncbi:MAG: tripartite tricarboxylate transporter permease [Candidatus Diapherotrites archaeon]|nr:tripartite tricarboxylate transporter permease [Candidatus Diapherotrites archaeon]
MIELLAFVLAGCFLGVITGMLPGLHVNNLSLILLLLFPTMPSNIIALIVAMAITHSFFDFLPSIVLGAPDSESYLSVLPGHRFLLKGRAYEALLLTIAGGLFAGIAAIILAPLFVLFLSFSKGLLPKIIPFVLITVLISMVAFSRNIKSSALVVLLSSLLGVFVLRNLSIKNGLMALIIGFFALSTLLISIIRESRIRKQVVTKQALSLKDSVKGSLLALAGASTIAIMPSIGPGQAAFILSKIFGKIKTQTYLVMLGGINTCNLIFSLFVLYALGKSRTGIALAISSATITTKELLLFCGAFLIAIAFSVLALKAIGSELLKRIHRVSYRKINSAILCSLFAFVFFACGFVGLLSSLVACFIAIYATANRVRRTNCMAFLMVPTILFYMGL